MDQRVKTHKIHVIQVVTSKTGEKHNHSPSQPADKMTRKSQKAIFHGWITCKKDTQRKRTIHILLLTTTALKGLSLIILHSLLMVINNITIIYKRDIGSAKEKTIHILLLTTTALKGLSLIILHSLLMVINNITIIYKRDIGSAQYPKQVIFLLFL